MGEADDDHCHRHIVLLPFMAQGHLIPFLSFAQNLCRRFPSLTLTIATTPLNARYLRSATDALQYSQLHFSELPFYSSEHGLPPNAENTEALPLHQVADLFYASTSLESPFRALIRDICARDGAPPLCIISDLFAGWANAVAKDFNTVNVTFITSGAYGTAAYVSVWQNLPHRNPDVDEFSVPGFPESHRFHTSHLDPRVRATDGTDSWSKFFRPQIENFLNSFGFICNTAEEIERFGLEVLRKYINRPVWCIGPLLPPNMTAQNPSRIIGQRTGREFGISPEECLRWLDLQPEKSVLYISFGSQNTISPSQMMALAMGLEDSRIPFIWVIRPPTGFDLKDEFRPEWLPEGFEEKMSSTKRGLVVHGWAPQLEILCHRSTAAFLSHCGWNSAMESLSRGVPMIGWPLAGEQRYNCKMLVEEMGVCVELTKGVESEITVEDVKRVIEAVVGREEMRRRAAEIGEMIRAAVTEEGGRKGSSCRALEEFVSEILASKQAPV